MNKQELVEGWARKLSAPDLKRPEELVIKPITSIGVIGMSPEDFQKGWMELLRGCGIPQSIMFTARPEALDKGFNPVVVGSPTVTIGELGILTVDSLPADLKPKLDLKSLIIKDDLYVGPVESGQEKRRKRRKKLNKK